MWNETGDTLEFSIDPAYYQTTWFYASCVAAFLAMLWGLYRLRLYQIRREFNAQLDGRVDERMRVARELHDTLLQSFQASLIQMQAARNVLARRPEKAEQSLDKAITTAAGAVAEGRSAIQNLRAHPAGEADLAQLLTAAGQELAHSEEAPENPPVFRLTVEGERRDLEPLLQDEVYRIARELLRNAFRHAQAGRIEAEIRYESRHLRVHIRDDGKGIDSEVLKAGGRAGHCGLPGMRERADRFGGKLEFWSEAGAGTEAVLTVPAAAAYATPMAAPFRSYGESCGSMNAETKTIRILTADDHALLRQGIAALVDLEPDMELVAQASTGREAIEQFRRHQPDITLMDLQMPDISGIEAIIAIRGEFPDARIVVLTTYAGDVQVVRALKAGARGYLLKGNVHTDLLETIRAVHAGRKRIPPEVAAELAMHTAEDELTARELEVLKLIAKGNANKEIAAQLAVAEDTVKKHVTSILEKLGANDRTHAVTIGLERGIIEL